MKKVITYTGVIQKEVHFLNVHCVTLGLEAERVSTLRIGKNIPSKKGGKNNIIADIRSKQISNFDDKPFERSNSTGLWRKQY